MASKGKQRAEVQDEQDEYPTFKEATVLKILETGFKKDDGSMQMSGPALSMATEWIRLYTLEAIHRSAESLQADPKPPKGDRGTTQPILDVKYLHLNTASLTLDFGV